MRSRKQPRDRVKNKARQSREQKSAAGSSTTIRNKQLCAARDSEKAPKHKRLPRSCSTSMCCERFREGPNHKRIPRSGSASTCCERFRERPKTQAFTPILFNIYVLPEIQRRPPSTNVEPDLVQHLCAARDLEKAPKHKHLPRSCSTSMYCERRLQNTRVYPDHVQHLCAARDLKKASEHKR